MLSILKKALFVTLLLVGFLALPPLISTAQAGDCRRFDDRFYRGRFHNRHFDDDFCYHRGRYADRRFDRRFDDDYYYRRHPQYGDRRYYDSGRYYGSPVPPLLGLPNAVLGSTVPPLLDLPNQIYYGTTVPLLDALIPR